MNMNTSLYDLVSEDVTLRKVAGTRGGEYHGPCPFCGGTDRFRVQPEANHWQCRQCGKSGDYVAYLVETKRITAKDAYNARRGKDPKRYPASVLRKQPRKQPLRPPSKQWQDRAWNFAIDAQTALWSEAGAKALNWLLNVRGVKEETIVHEYFGYYPGTPEYDSRERWGLEQSDKSVWLPRGVTIPWFSGGNLWRVNIRRPIGEPKYYGVAGWKNALYNADQLSPKKPAIIVEGEFDVLIIDRYAGDLITPVGTGANTGSRRSKWIAMLEQCPVVLASFDNDDAGMVAREWWIRKLHNAFAWTPTQKDASEMGASVRQWIEYGLEEARR